MSEESEIFDQTTGALARDAGVTVALIQKYADLGLIQFIRASNAQRLFRRGQADRVREIYSQRMSNRGRKAG